MLSSSSRLLRKKQPVNYKPTPLNRSLTLSDVSGNPEGGADETAVSPNHRDQVVTEDGRIFFPCPYCSRAFSENAKRSMHLDACPAKSYILSVANSVKPEQTPDHQDSEDGNASSVNTARLLDKTHSFSEEEQRAFMQAVQLAKVNDIISENNYNMVINRFGQRKRISQKVNSLIHNPSNLKSYHLDVSPKTAPKTTAVKKKTVVKSKSTPKNTAVKKGPEKSAPGKKSRGDGVSVPGKPPKKSKPAPTQKIPKATPKKSTVKKVGFNVQTPKRLASTQTAKRSQKSKPVPDKNVKKNSKSKSERVIGSVSSKKSSIVKKVSLKAKPSEPKSKSTLKKTTAKKIPGKQVKASGKVGVAKSKATKVIATKISKSAKVIGKQNKTKTIKKVTSTKTNAKNSKNKRNEKVSQTKETVSKQIIIAPSTDMNALEMKLADLVNLISDGNNSGSQRLSLKKDEKTGSLVITSETEVGKPKTPTKRPAQNNPVPAKKKKTCNKDAQIINSTFKPNPTAQKTDTKTLLAESILTGPEVPQTPTVLPIFEDAFENHSEIKENKVPGNQNLLDKLKKQAKKKTTENKKSNSSPNTNAKKKTSLPKIVLKTVTGKKNALNTSNKNKRGGQAKKVNTGKAKLNPTKAAVTAVTNKTKGKIITKPVTKRVMERNLKQTNKIVMLNVEQTYDVDLASKVSSSKQEQQNDTSPSLIKAQTMGETVTKPGAKRITEDNTHRANKMGSPYLEESGDMILIPDSEELGNSKLDERGDASPSVINAQEVQTKGRTATKAAAKRIMVRNLKQTVNISTVAEPGDVQSKDNSNQMVQPDTLLSVIKEQELQTQSSRKRSSQNRKTVQIKKTRPSNTVSDRTDKSPSKTNNVACDDKSIDLDVEEIPAATSMRMTRSNKEMKSRGIPSLPTETTITQVPTQQKTSQIIRIDDDIIELEDDVIELDVDTSEHRPKQTRTSKGPLSNEELLSLLSVDNDTEVEYIIQNPISRETSLTSRRSGGKIQTKSQEATRKAGTVQPMSARQKSGSKPNDDAKPSTSRIDQTSLIQELILNNIPRDDMHPRKLESYIKQFAAAVNAKEFSERSAASSEVEIIEDGTQTSTADNPDVMVCTKSPPERAKDVVVRTEEECEAEEMDPLLLEDGEEDEQEEEEETNSSVASQSSIASMGPVSCKYCPEVFENPIELLRHKRQVHTFSKILLPDAKIQEYVNAEDFSRCPICQKPLKLHPTLRSKNKWSYIKHLHTHNKDMHFTCPKCHKRFKRQDHMKVHERRHY